VTRPLGIAWFLYNAMGGAPPRPRGAPPAQPVLDSLFLLHEGRRYRVAKTPFVIGRHPTSDLSIESDLVSRRHAMIVRYGDRYYLYDVDSTNGIVYGGRRVFSRRIDEGDVFRIAFHELMFTYRRD
jgi:pSer/pThr/pTyr-binding forkhead associated (FHA) protein